MKKGAHNTLAPRFASCILLKHYVKNTQMEVNNNFHVSYIKPK